MSNYLIAALSPDTRPAIEAWVALHASDDSEHRFVPVPGGELLIMSRRVSRSVAGNHFVRGTVVSENGDKIGYGLSAWPIISHGPASITGGEYVAAAWSFRDVAVWTDTYRAVPLLYTSGPGIVATSDSMLLLADLRRHLGLAVSANDEAVIARSRTLALHSQQLSSDTFVQEISWCPAGRHLRIAFDHGEPTVRVHGTSAYEKFSSTDMSYQEMVRAACGAVAGQMRAITSLDGAVPMLGLTGGRDSRVLLAGAIRAGDVGRMLVHVHKATSENDVDYERAVEIARVRGFRINNPKDFDFGETVSYGASTPTAIWATAFMGTYDRLVPNHTSHGRPLSIPMTGLGAELSKGNYGWRSLEGVLDYFTSERADSSVHRVERAEAFEAQFRKGLSDLGVPDDHPWASEWHYLGYRNGLHSGAHLAMTMIGLRPLNQSVMARFALNPEARKSVDTGTQLIPDMLSVMHKEVASLPYDRPEREITLEEASRRRSALGGALQESEIPEVQILGHPTEVPLGPLSHGLRIAEQAGLDLDHGDPDGMLAAARDWLDGIAHPTTKAIYEDLFTLTRNQFARLKPSHAGPGPAKLLAARLFV
ncbi:hypothetical protein WBG06_21310 [Nocardioides sp. CCNWLW239]|uniref:hypothetical protein n=1 Tax=Nocardioides sp. CCNWLW239 TaxID=3128902 RepID=UPI003019B46F